MSRTLVDALAILRDASAAIDHAISEVKEGKPVDVARLMRLREQEHVAWRELNDVWNLLEKKHGR